MKNDHLYPETGKGNHRSFFVSVVIGFLLLFNNTATAQDVKDSASLSAGQAGKLSFKMKLSSLVLNGTKSVKVQVTRKENGLTVGVNDIKSPINLYLNEVKAHDPSDRTGWISKLKLDYEGEAIHELTPEFNKLDSGLHEYTFIVKMESDPKYEDAEESITVTDAKISVVYSGEDSIKTATAILTAWKDGAYVPVPEAELKLCIRRTFNFLIFGEAGVLTDSTGQVSGELPLDIPGNANGTISIFGRLEEHETYGTVEEEISVPWAVLPKKNPERGRTLWSSGDNAPLILVISSVAIIIIIWGTIFYLIKLLFKIKRLGKN